MEVSQLSQRLSTMPSSLSRSTPEYSPHGQKYFDRSDIDLTKEENFLLRDEMVGICKSAIDDKLLSQHLSYPDNLAGDPGLLESFARFFNNYFNPNIRVEPSHIATAGGVSSALDALLYNICEPGDGVLVPVGFDLQILARSSVEPFAVNLANFFEMPISGLIPSLAATVDRAPCPVRALILSNPHKTLGKCYPQEILEACLLFCQQRDIHFISDEEYALTAFPCAEMANPLSFVSAMSLDTEMLRCDRSRIHTIWSISKDFGASGFRLGCIVSQDNEELLTGLALTPNLQTSSLSTIFATALLSSPTLPFLIALNSARLAESYILITSFFTEHQVRFIPVNAGLNIFARLAPRAKTWEDEDMMVAKLEDVGVLVSAGRHFHGMPKEKGWARLAFSVEPARLQEALQRIVMTLGTSIRSSQ